MSALVVEVDGRVLRLEGKTSYRIGRAIEADVVLTAGSVSRQHAELRSTGHGWVLVDAGSQFGTYVEGERITEYPIERRIPVRCGPPARGSDLTVVPAEQYDAEAAATPRAPAPSLPATPPPPDHTGQRFAPPAGPPPPGIPGVRPAPPAGVSPYVPGDEVTQVLAPVPRGPGPGQPPGVPVQRTGPDLLLVTEGREHRFRHPAQITIGRRSDSTVVIGDPSCSREHGRVDAYPGGWAYTNLSNEGTFLGGRRLTGQRFDERISLRLGHPVAGPELTLVPILSSAEEERRIARRRLGKRLVVAGGVLGVLVLIAGVLGAAWLIGSSDDERAGRTPSDGGSGSASSPAGSLESLSDLELETAKAATVKITAETTDDLGRRVGYGGSGSIIREDGLILTNAHVAQPEAPGLEQYGELGINNPDYLLVHLTDGMSDTNSEPRYRARVVVADGTLDVAVIQVYATADGAELDEEVDLPIIPIGSSDELRAGDDVTVLGFPAVARSEDSITVTRGVISTVINDPELGPRSELDTDARIAPGNSGGMAVNNDAQLIGIPTAVSFDRDTPVISGRIRSIDVVKDLIEQAEDAVG